jgi:hypothetical protein
MRGRLLSSAAAVVAAALIGIAVVGVLQHAAATDEARERRALVARNAELTRAALQPGSALACLDGEAGEKAGDACEAAVFASAPSVAAAVAFAGERLSILKAAFDLSKLGDTQIMPALASARRAAELDRYGLAAHVLAERDGCTVAQCPALAMFTDTAALKANLKARAFEAYVARYAPHWGKPAEAAPPPVAAVPKETSPAIASIAPPPAEPPHDTQGTAKPVDRKWTFPSSDSIPAVSIMKSEPALPKSAELPEPKVDPDLAKSVGATPEPVKPAEAPRLPPKRPQTEAAPPVEPR